MKTTSLAYAGFALLLGLGRFAIADEPAKVTEAVNKVTYGPSASAVDTHMATLGTLIQSKQSVGTGKNSRAELQLPSLSITRLGPYTIFNYDASSNTVDLKEGDILFCKPKEAKELRIKTTAVMAGIVGTTGFTSVQTDPKTHQTTYSFGIIEGHSHVQANGQDFDIGPGEELQFTPPSKPFKFSFNIPHFVETSLFFKGFKKGLPNKKYIDEAIADYNDKVDRGFIQPDNGIQNSTNYAGIPNVPTTALDSAQNAQGDHPPPPNPNR